MCCFMDSSESSWTPRSRTTEVGMMISELIWIWCSWLCSLFRLALDPNQMTSVLSAFSCSRRDSHHCTSHLHCFMLSFLYSHYVLSAFLINEYCIIVLYLSTVFSLPHQRERRERKCGVANVEILVPDQESDGQRTWEKED